MNKVQDGRSGADAPSGCQPSASAPDGSSQSGIPNALFSPMVYLSCPICFGSRQAFSEPCRTCADPNPVVARKVLQRLREDQMRFLRAFAHTLANQPVTGAEWDEFALCDFYIEDDDGVDDPDDYAWLVPPAKIWFASSQASLRYGSIATFVRYNPLGLLLRECLIAGADAMLPAPASGIVAATAGETEGLDERSEQSPVGDSRDAQKVHP